MNSYKLIIIKLDNVILNYTKLYQFILIDFKTAVLAGTINQKKFHISWLNKFKKHFILVI